MEDLGRVESRLGPHTAAALRRFGTSREASLCSPAASAAPASRQALAETAGPESLTVIGNVGDDVEVLGLHVSPDLDSVLYTLAGASTSSGAGDGRARHGASSRPSASLGGPSLVSVGDRDHGFHLVRSGLCAR